MSRTLTGCLSLFSNEKWMDSTVVVLRNIFSFFSPVKQNEDELLTRKEDREMHSIHHSYHVGIKDSIHPCLEYHRMSLLLFTLSEEGGRSFSPVGNTQRPRSVGQTMPHDHSNKRRVEHFYTRTFPVNLSVTKIPSSLTSPQATFFEGGGNFSNTS